MTHLTELAQLPNQSRAMRHYITTMRRLAEVAKAGPTSEDYAVKMVNLSAAAAKQRRLMTDDELATIQAAERAY